MNKLIPRAYLSYILEKAAPLVDLPYNETTWKTLLSWEIDQKVTAWQDRMNTQHRKQFFTYMTMSTITTSGSIQSWGWFETYNKSDIAVCNS